MSKTREQEAAILKNLAGAWMLLNGQELPAVVIPTVVKALEVYSTEAILEAIEAVVLAGTGRMTLGVLVERLNAADGRPSPEEAWAIAVSTHGNEAITVTWTAETAQAWAEVGQSLMDSGDRFNASRGFISKYTELVQAARRNRIPVQWIICQGWDKELRHQAIQQAVAAGRITRQYAAMIHPRNQDAGPVVAAIAQVVTPLIASNRQRDEVTPERLAEIKAASERLAAMTAKLAQDAESVSAPAKPSVEHGVRIVNAAIEAGVLTSVREMDDWMTKARNREDMSLLQARILDSSVGVGHVQH